eukprot:3777955-Amphidinium_carterae.4
MQTHLTLRHWGHSYLRTTHPLQRVGARFELPFEFVSHMNTHHLTGEVTACRDDGRPSWAIDGHGSLDLALRPVPANFAQESLT